MSINGKEIAKMSVRDAEGVIKAVPRGLVKIVAMVPRKYKPTKELPKITETPVEKDEDEGVVTVKVRWITTVQFIVLCFYFIMPSIAH